MPWDWKRPICAPMWRRSIDMSLLPPDNAIAWAHFAMRGGWRKTLPLIAGYAAIIGVAILLTVQFNPNYRTDIYSGWTTGLLAIQGALLVLYGCGRIGKTVTQDIAGRMMESHRMMPAPPAHAIAG